MLCNLERDKDRISPTGDRNIQKIHWKGQMYLGGGGDSFYAITALAIEVHYDISTIWQLGSKR